MRSTWNPTRRNKHIGTKAQGHGLNNKLVIPESWHKPQCYFEILTSCVLVKQMIGDKQQLFFVEPTYPNWFYPCTVEDIITLLTHCTTEAINSFDYIIFRQPTKKQHILRSIWGRAQFEIDINHYQGSTIIIEAQTLKYFVWHKSLTPDDLKELKRLESDGHTIIKKRRNIIISPSITAMRNTVLFRTLLHEIGHHIDYCKNKHKWHEKTHAEKESYAHRYAEQQRQILLSKHIIPFAPIIDQAFLDNTSLKLEWFMPNN